MLALRCHGAVFGTFSAISLLVVLILGGSSVLAQDKPDTPASDTTTEKVQEGDAPKEGPLPSDVVHIDAEKRPLQPPNTSSPRGTLQSLIINVDRAYQRFLADEPPEAVRRPILRAVRTLDLSDVAPSGRKERAIRTILLLKEILDRIELPAMETIPDYAVVEEKGLTRWTIPYTEITLAKQAEGPRQDEFLFTPTTVNRALSFYEEVQDLPYKPGATAGIYDVYRNSPGPMLPARLTDGFPDWALDEYFENPLWQWIGVALAVIVAGPVVWLIYRLGKYWDDRHRKASPWLQFGKPVSVVALIAIAIFVNKLIDEGINISGSAAEVTDLALQVVFFGAAIWGAFLLLNRIATGIIHAQEMRAKGIDSQLVRIGFRLLSIFAVVYLLVAGADAVGIPVAPLIAGLGVGGLAIALAVRPTLENVIGGLILFVDKPVRIGDFCRYGDQIGTVEQIGLRSTRIRSLERTIVTVPNAEFSQMQLDNFAARDLRLLKTVLGLRYETTPEQLRYVLTELRKMLLGHPMVTPDPARVRFVGYGAYSLNLEVFAYLRCQDHSIFLAIQEDILLRMADIIKDAGTGFAFPSQTHYHRRDAGIDAERGREVEAKVEGWREHDRLPFPEFDPGLRWEMEDILDYPQRGAYDYKHQKGLSEDSTSEPQEPTPPEPKGKGRRLGFGSKRR